ncbi:MarR family transcriptional regulator [Rubrobacter taiwanensis]|jgi:DNA-binding MarR family transcriptional regulator|uniref:MarR family transcriptional regulator n=1 Tax=Rubrobacter taiwanensis TaxID=185139 RepID=A0A4R1B9P6_9ACTN|nr:MarR family transcriptional regulator [Rubrobacter taiwanensis]TCJ13646.1 MarR family transcriptional regulator [Rubrobacter taiwanensis]
MTRGEKLAEKFEGFSPFHPLLAPLGLATRRFLRLFERESGFSAPKWFILAVLEREDGLSQGEVSQLFELDPSRVTRIGQALESDGFIRRDRCEADNRVVRMYLTDKGREHLERLPAFREGIHRRIREALGEAEQAELKRMLEALAEAMKR